MIGHKYTRSSRGFADNLLEHGELVGGHRNIFVDATLEVPAREVAAIGAREGSGAESADRGALPIAVVDVGFVFADAGSLERLPERPAPRDFRDLVAQTGLRDQQHAQRGSCSQQQEQILSHRASEGAGVYNWVQSDLPTATFPGVLLRGTG